MIFKNTINDTVQGIVSAADQIGMAALHTLAPDDLEYYLCTLELLDSTGVTQAYLSFVVMPNNITESQTQIATITKTNKGVTTLFNDSFNPGDINIQGTFGKKIRLVIGMKQIGNNSEKSFFKDQQFGSVNGTIWNGNQNSKSVHFNENIMIKTGYGLTRMLRNMIEYSWKLDKKGKPYILIFSNHAFNTSYVVEAPQRAWIQNLENNMIWFYNLNLKAVAPASAVKKSSIGDNNVQFLTKVADNSISKSLDKLISDVLTLKAI